MYMYFATYIFNDIIVHLYLSTLFSNKLHVGINDLWRINVGSVDILYRSKDSGQYLIVQLEWAREARTLI